MPFWDRFVLALYFGLAHHLLVGRAAALRILDLAVAHRRLSLSSLNNTSLLLLLALLPKDSPHRAEVASLAVSRGVDQHSFQFSQLLMMTAPPRLKETIEIYRLAVGPDQTGPILQAVALNALHAPNELRLLEDLGLYLARRFLIDPSHTELRDQVVSLITNATQRYSRIPLGTVDYLAWVYRVVRWQTRPGEPLPPISPPITEPEWFQVLTPDKRRFAEVCEGILPEPAMELLCLHFCALLSVDQIIFALELHKEEGVPEVIGRLEQCWDEVLRQA